MAAIKGNVKAFQDILEKEDPKSFENWRFQIEVQLSILKSSKDEDNDETDSGFGRTVKLNLTLLHIIVMNSKTKLLNILLKKDISDKYWEIPVLVKIPSIDILGEDAVVSVEEMKFIGSEDSWIFNANCFHLAAKYNPRGLHMLLCYWKTHGKSIEAIPHNGNIHPLHVAAAKVDDSRSTR